MKMKQVKKLNYRDEEQENGSENDDSTNDETTEE
jgi:hypothetical protein